MLAYHVEDTVWIESWVDEYRCIEDHVPNVAALVEFHACARERQESLGRVCDVLRHVICIVTLLCERVHLRKESLTV